MAWGIRKDPIWEIISARVTTGLAESLSLCCVGGTQQLEPVYEQQSLRLCFWRLCSFRSYM